MVDDKEKKLLLISILRQSMLDTIVARLRMK